MTSQNHLLSLPELPKVLVSLAENPVVLLLLAVLALAASRAPRDNTAMISIAAYFGCTAVLNFVFSIAPFYEGLIYIMSCLTAFAMISFLYLSGSYSLSTKLSAIVFLVLCAESGIMALDELNFRAEITLAYLLDPYIQIAADAMLLIIGGASVFHSAASRGDTDRD
ncbi:MAG: hypothetical protein ACRDCY_21165 [Aeromonas veronii]